MTLFWFENCLSPLLDLFILMCCVGIPLVGAVNSGHRAFSGPQRAEVMCLLWRCIAIARSGHNVRPHGPCFGTAARINSLAIRRAGREVWLVVSCCGHWISHLHALEMEVNDLTGLPHADTQTPWTGDDCRGSREFRRRDWKCLENKLKSVWTLINSHCVHVYKS